MNETDGRRTLRMDAPGTRLVHVELLRPGPDDDGLFGDYGRALVQAYELSRLPDDLLVRGDSNRALAEVHLEYHRNRMRITLFGDVPARVEPSRMESCSSIRIRLNDPVGEEAAMCILRRVNSSRRKTEP